VTLRAYALALAIAHARIVAADPEADADRAFHAAEQHAVAGAPQAIDELEAIGRRAPPTRWSDDAWTEAARLAERVGDYDRARRDLEQAIALPTADEHLVQRARADLARLAQTAGPAGEWSAVAAAHERAMARLAADGDPGPALRELEILVDAHPGYPRAWAAMIEIARGWDRDGDGERALTWLRRARGLAPAGADRNHATAELVRVLVRHDELAAARSEIATLDDPELVRALRGRVERAELRRVLRWVALAVLASLLALVAIALRRAAGSWRAIGGYVVRPPGEVLFLAPIAIVLVALAGTSNPLAARAVRAIAIAGVVTAWLSGTLLEAVRAKHGRIRRRRAIGHAIAAVVAIAAATYIAIDRDRLIDLVIETWRAGPELR
jgi:tetratricopeptide (TPR) repeat protein